MVTKGIITSIDFNGNTCQVRIPFFETAGNDPIIGTAIVSNTPGSYNGYKVDDVVLVAFEDGKMETPVVIGKLYLGAEKEKADPRGSLNTESLVAAKTAAVPADTKLTTNTDKNLPNTMNPYANLSSIANNLNKLNTDVNYLDVFTNNQFSSVITDVNKQGEELRSEIKQTAENIENKVVHKHEDGSQEGLGWNLDETGWKINAQDTVTNGNGETKVKDINIVTITREGMSIAGDLKLNGYPKNIIVRYAQNGSDKDHPNLYNFKQVDFPDTKIDKTWYHNKYIKIIEADKEKYILISDENIDDYNIIPGETVAYIYNLEEINTEWKTETPKRVDGKYIWQWTHTESFLFDKNTNSWNEQDDDKIVCITGADGKDGTAGEPATTYWAKLSTAVHTGKNQKSDIEITPYAKTGSSQEDIDKTAHFKYSLDNGASWNNKDWTSVASLQDNKIIILANDIRADNIIVKLAHAYTDPNDSTKLIYSEYETETITYSPLNTPIIDLTNDTDVIKYKPDGTNITGSVVSTAQVYLGGSPEAASYTWSCSPKNGADFTVTKEEPQKITVTGISSSSDKAILTCTATTTNFKDKNGNKVKISKDFVVSREVVVASYWLSFSPVHTGTLQQTDIEVRALAKIGNDSESKDTNTYFRYSWDNGTTWIHKDWTKPTDATLIIPKADIQNNNLRVQATHDSEGDNRQVYEDETITYSPLNTPVLDLTNDSDAIAYDGNTILGNSVSSTAAVYLNGTAISGCTFAWTATNCTISGATDSATVTVSAIDDNKSEGTATCKVTSIPKYKGTELVKVFTVAKQYKGNKGADGPTPKSSTTYYIYSADTPALDDPKWQTDPASLDKPSGGYFCWTKTVTTYSDGNAVTDGPNKDAAFALAQGKSTNYYSPTEPRNNIKEGDCWFKTISSTNSEYNEDAAGQKQGKLYQCSGFDADGKAIWEDVGGELVANKLTANYINAMDITAKKISILDEKNPVFIANTVDPTSGPYDVNIGGFSVDSSTLLNGNFGDDKSVLVSTGYKNTSSIGGSPAGVEKDWAFVAGNKFGVTTAGELFASNLTISGYATNDELKSATAAANSYADTAASEAKSNAVSEIENKGYQTKTDVTTITENTIKTTDVIAENLQVKKLLVKDSNENVLLDAGAGNQYAVQIGGFTVDSNRLYTGTPGTYDSIEIAKVHNLIAYKSNNQGKDLTSAICKIKVNKDITNLTVYIRSDAESGRDYTMISKPNVSSYPTSYSSSDVKEHTRLNQNSSSELTGYKEVEYYDLKQNNWIYVVYRKDESIYSGTDTGYLLIPETTDISIEAVDDMNYTFVRDTSLDIKEAGASLKVGSNFSVDSTGAIKSTSGTIGNLSIANGGLAYKSSSTSFEIGQESSDLRMPKYAIYSSAQRIDDCIMGLKDTSYGENLWFEFKPDGYYTYMSNDNTNATITGKIPYEHMKHICWLNSVVGSHVYTGANATCPQIIVLNASVNGASFQTVDLSTYGINEIIGAQITEKRTATSSGTNGVSGHGFKVDGKTIYIYNGTTVDRTYSVLVIAI